MDKDRLLLLMVMTIVISSLFVIVYAEDSDAEIQVEESKMPVSGFVDGIGDFFSGIGEAISNFFSGIADFFSNIFNSGKSDGDHSSDTVYESSQFMVYNGPIVVDLTEGSDYKNWFLGSQDNVLYFKCADIQSVLKASTPIKIISNSSITQTVSIGESTSEEIKEGIQYGSSYAERNSNSGLNGFSFSIAGWGAGFNWDPGDKTTTNYKDYLYEKSKKIENVKEFSTSITIPDPEIGKFYRLAEVMSYKLIECVTVDLDTKEYVVSFIAVYEGEYIEPQSSDSFTFSEIDKPNDSLLSDNDIKSAIGYYFDMLTSPSEDVNPGDEVLGTVISDFNSLKAIKNNPGGDYILTNDVVSDGTMWEPFAFSGTLNGNGYKVSGITIDSRSGAYESDKYVSALFTNNTGSISNLTLDNCVVKYSPNTKGKAINLIGGIIVAQNTGLIEKCTVKNCTISIASTNIDDLWLASHEKLPTFKSGSGARDTDWAKYASLKFTGTWSVNWEENKQMIVKCGGICGQNSATIRDCTVKNTEVVGKLINFNLNGNASASKSYVAVGGVAGFNECAIKNCIVSIQPKAELKLHDSGDGAEWGLGYVDPYKPKGTAYCGGIAGESNGQINGCESTTLGIVNTDIFAPVYCTIFLPPAGAHYDGNKANSSSIIISAKMICGKEN